jgi:hypothetical protein
MRLHRVIIAPLIHFFRVCSMLLRHIGHVKLYVSTARWRHSCMHAEQNLCLHGSNVVAVSDNGSKHKGHSSSVMHKPSSAARRRFSRSSVSAPVSVLIEDTISFGKGTVLHMMHDEPEGLVFKNVQASHAHTRAALSPPPPVVDWAVAGGG